MKKIVMLLIVCLCALGNTKMQAQEKNPFLQASYWKTQPSIANIEINIKKGFSITEANSGGFDAVTYAIFSNSPISIIEYLIHKGNSVNKKTHDSRTYIFWAASRGNLELMEYLVKNGARTDLKDSHGYSLMQFAAATGQEDPKLYDFCIANGADPLNEKDHDGRNVLHIIIGRLKNFTMVDYFVNKGIDLNGTDDEGNGVFNFVARSGNIEMLNALIKKGVAYKENNNIGGNAMLFASRNSKNPLSFYTYLESLGIDPNVKTADGQTPLHYLAYGSSNKKIYEYFMDKGVSIDQMDKDSNTPLMRAASRNSLEMVTYLAEKSSAIDKKNNDGKTALTYAIQRNSPKVVTYLISKNADVKTIDTKGNNLGYYLVRSYYEGEASVFDAKLKALIEEGFDPKDVQKDGNTLFHSAIEKGNLSLLKKINTLGVAINAKNAKGNSVLHYAAMKSKTNEILKYLLTIGADRKSTTEFGETVYELAQENELLQRNNIDIEFLK